MPLLDLYSLWGSPSTPSVAVVSQLQVLYQADILVDGVAGSTEFCRIKLELIQALNERTQYGDIARSYLPALYAAHADGDFFYQAGNGGDLVAPYLETVTRGPVAAFVPLTLTLAPDLTVGNLVNIWRGVSAALEAGARHGDVLKGSLSTEAAERCVQAKRLLRAQQSGSSGLGQAVNLGAVGSTQSLYAAMHVIGTTGTPAGTTFSIVSSPSSTLASTTPRVTFTSGTSGYLGEWESAAGAVSDTWFAAQWSGFAGTAFTASISAGIE